MPVVVDVQGTPDEVRARLLALGREWRDSAQPRVLRQNWYQRCHVREVRGGLELELGIQAGRPRFVAYLEAFPMSAKENRTTLVLRVHESPGSIRLNIAQSAIFVVIVGLGIGPWMALASLVFFAVIFPMGS